MRRKAGSGRLRRVIIILLCILAALEAVWFLFVYSNVAPIAHLRSVAIQTAMSTMHNQWLATSFFPKSVIDDVMGSVETARTRQIRVNTTWQDAPAEATKTVEPQTNDAEEAFYARFPLLERSSFDRWCGSHPEATADGWENVLIDESALDAQGTDILTVYGDSVLAVDAVEGVLLIRVSGGGWRGVLAMAEDPARVSVCASRNLGGSGQYAGKIAEDHGGVLAMTASGFEDEDGVSNGGTICGYAMCEGAVCGFMPLGYGYKRVELHEDDRLYIADSGSPVPADCTDAVEFAPALIVDGEIVVDDTSIWTAINPRTCIGQCADGTICMLSIEGRQLTSLGTTVVECAEVLSRYGCLQAMNLDGGTSSILWYRGKCVTRCSNSLLPEGRTLPNAWVYRSKEKTAE
ncbi:MAG: phosphodiester glycosidase family protein [Oscillospiraceae bacterium]|nr:phosphodiester glycosidase family protein [Oscillospiraceae bacterium]